MKARNSSLGCLSSVIGEYLSLRADDFKRNIISGLSIGFSRMLAILLITLFLFTVCSVFAFALILIVGEAIGSLAVAALIVGGFYFIVATILFALRKRLFLNMFTSLFTEIVDMNSPTDRWKSLLLILVRNLRSSLEGGDDEEG